MKFYSTEEIAQMLKVGVIQVRRWLASGKLGGTRVGKRWLVTPQELDEFIRTKGGKK